MIRIEIHKGLLFVLGGIWLTASAFEHTGLFGWCAGLAIVGFGMCWLLLGKD